MPHQPRPAFWGSLSFLSLSMLAIAFSAITASAQLQESFEGFMIGIRANAVVGDVFYQRKDGKFDLESGLKLEEGDFIGSGAEGFAELLLQPGNYLRLGFRTQCQILSDQHDKMRLKLDHGTISLEILVQDIPLNYYYSPDQTNELIRVITANAEVFIVRPGIIRIAVSSAGQTEVIVREGEALINGQRVKEKRRARATGAEVTVTEIDSRIEDSFDVWARERADKLVRANKLLKKEAPWYKRSKGKQAEASVKLSDEEEVNTRGRVISARPGAVNFVDTGVEFSRTSKEWQQLTEKSQLETGDRLRTSANSFVELVLFPDTHLRLDASSEILFEQLSNDSISLKLSRGAAILDVARFDLKQDPQITFAGTATSVAIAEAGNYRIDVNPTGDAIMVREGKVVFNGRSVSSCRRIAGGIVSDCGRKRNDSFDFWSEHRGEGQVRTGRGTVSLVTHLTGLRRLQFRDTGFWFQQPGQTSYIFVPFTSGKHFHSPYGGNYSTVLTPGRRPMIRMLPGPPSGFRDYIPRRRVAQ